MKIEPENYEYENEEKDLSSKIHDLLRFLQWFLPAIITLYGVFDKVFGWGLMGTVETIGSGVVAFIGIVAQNSSRQYFETKTIVTKILPDKPTEDKPTEEE